MKKWLKILFIVWGSVLITWWIWTWLSKFTSDWSSIELLSDKKARNYDNVKNNSNNHKFSVTLQWFDNSDSKIWSNKVVWQYTQEISNNEILNVYSNTNNNTKVNDTTDFSTSLWPTVSLQPNDSNNKQEINDNIWEYFHGILSNEIPEIYISTNDDRIPLWYDSDDEDANNTSEYKYYNDYYDKDLSNAMKDMSLRSTFCPNIFCQQVADDWTYQNQKHYYRDSKNKKMVLIPNVYYVSDCAYYDSVYWELWKNYTTWDNLSELSYIQWCDDTEYNEMLSKNSWKIKNITWEILNYDEAVKKWLISENDWKNREIDCWNCGYFSCEHGCLLKWTEMFPVIWDSEAHATYCKKNYIKYLQVSNLIDINKSNIWKNDEEPNSQEDCSEWEVFRCAPYVPNSCGKEDCGYRCFCVPQNLYF